MVFDKTCTEYLRDRKKLDDLHLFKVTVIVERLKCCLSAPYLMVGLMYFDKTYTSISLNLKKQLASCW